MVPKELVSPSVLRTVYGLEGPQAALACRILCDSAIFSQITWASGHPATGTYCFLGDQAFQDLLSPGKRKEAGRGGVFVFVFVFLQIVSYSMGLPEVWLGRATVLLPLSYHGTFGLSVLPGLP